ncbi:type II secretion system F family protein [Vallitalea pronyensis]|uniref:Type II secretion system F family protein n=1 Tax=Vallitalea pronyensis TaxID=1348613 RepID=A0A8J8MGA0_9FIRM|nr:type II secretion system F family protein [Vallitalea pronyensis]QUI20926.1 type II secretion system F family protein [Vallitalea pronyensis]
MKIQELFQKQQHKTLIHYDIYELTLAERLKYTFLAMGVIYIMGLLFYNHHVIALMLSFLGLFYPKLKKPDLVKKRKQALKAQFKEMIYALSSSLGAGKSIESAFKAVLKDLRILYPNPQTSIIMELEYIVRKIEMNETIEEAIEDFAKRASIDDITNFSNVFTTAKRTGGNIISIIAYTSRTISEKMEIQNEIEVLVASKQFEQKILSLLVPLIIVYLQISSPGYLNVMYTSLQGRVLMTISLIIFMISYKVGQKITNIEV